MNLKILFLKEKTKNNRIKGTILTLYSISWTPNGNIDEILSLKYFSSGLKKNDKKKVFKNQKRESNCIIGYFLEKLFKINNTADIFDIDIRTPRDKDKIKLIKIFKCLAKWE